MGMPRGVLLGPIPIIQRERLGTSQFPEYACSRVMPLPNPRTGILWERDCMQNINKVFRKLEFLVENLILF